ncbi:hypothetical protein WMF11_41710 [Sorangium sp. So ce295]|uniref:hypothetical protein n=1 Tax=Sorangium sp. So ce295 TaxID=3133295 RepID=UPI003F5FBE90
MPAPTKIAELLGVLARHRVDFIVVGGVAAVIQGAPVNTFDLDVVHARTPDNIERLLGALRELDAVYRIDLQRRLSPTASHLASTGHQLLATNMGTLDLLGTMASAALPAPRDVMSSSTDVVSALRVAAALESLGCE